MGKDKNRHTIWLNDDIWRMVGSHYKANNCTTQNEFIEQAIQFYCGYLDTEQEAVFLPVALSTVLEGSLGALGDRLGKLLFKMSVEMSICISRACWTRSAPPAQRASPPMTGRRWKNWRPSWRG